MAHLTNVVSTPSLVLPDYIGQRGASFRFELVDSNGERLGEIAPTVDGSVPSISHDTSRTITRAVSELSFGKVDTAEIDPAHDRVKISMVVGGLAYPLGIYLFSNWSRYRFSSGLLASGSLVDQMFILDQPMDRGFSASANAGDYANILAAKLLARYPAIQYAIEATSLRSVGSWAVGTHAAKVLSDLALDGGYLPPWFDNNGILQLRLKYNPDDHIADIDWDDGRSVVADTIVEGDDLLETPNRVIVISNGGVNPDLPIVGIYNTPDAAAHSASNRGFVVSEQYNMQIETVAQARAIATLIGSFRRIFTQIDLATAPDPRHDGHQTINWQGQHWLETAWSMFLQEGGLMQHTIYRPSL